MLLKRVREVMGEDRLVVVNCPTITDGVNPGMTLEQTADVLKALAPYIDLIHLRDQFTGDPEGAPANAALQSQALKELGVKTPFAVNTPFMDLDKMGKILADGQAEMISAARMFICNDDLGQIIEEEDLVPCLRCDICHGLSFTGDWLSACTLNLVIGRKHRISRMIDQPGPSKRVAIKGGGPAGMKVALELKKRGHTPVISPTPPHSASSQTASGTMTRLEKPTTSNAMTFLQLAGQNRSMKECRTSMDLQRIIIS